MFVFFGAILAASRATKKRPMNRNFYLLAAVATLVFASCKSLTREKVTLYIDDSETLTGMQIPAGTDSRFSCYQHSDLREALTERLANKMDSRSVEIIDQADAADYVLTLQEVTVKDWVECETYTNACGSNCLPWQSNDRTVSFDLHRSTLTLTAQLTHASSDQVRGFTFSETYCDKVRDCYDSEADCTEYDVCRTNDKEALRKYGRQTGKRLRNEVWAMEDVK